MIVNRDNCKIPKIGVRGDGTFYLNIPKDIYDQIVSILTTGTTFFKPDFFQKVHFIFDFDDWYRLQLGLNHLVSNNVISKEDEGYYIKALDEIRPKNLKPNFMYFDLNNPNVQKFASDLRLMGKKHTQEQETLSSANKLFVNDKFNEALAQYLDILDVKLNAVGGKSESLLPIYERIADCYTQLNNKDKALENYQEAVDCDLYNKDVELSDRLNRLYGKMANVAAPELREKYFKKAELAHEDYMRGLKSFHL